MKLSAFKKQLESVTDLRFTLPDGRMVPPHFHVTEVGQVNKHFIDCGGTVRDEKKVSFQLWEANDFDHRLAPQKLLNIIALSEKVLGVEDAEIEVEYQGETIGKYGLEYTDAGFMLTANQTACLASDACGIPAEKQKIKLADLGNGGGACCTPGGGCC
ncbi:MAG: hypothetical protein JST26_09390 [Bacteroidetes bacterium]|nr:hypothetical protein [Bacteroidota bacterium]